MAIEQLYRQIITLPQIGTRTAKLIAKLAGKYLIDLLMHLPNNLIDRSFRPKIAQAINGKIATLDLTVDSIKVPPSYKAPTKVRCYDDTGVIDLIFFRANKNYIAQMLPIGGKVSVSGKVEFYGKVPQIVHPDSIASANQNAPQIIELFEPIYPLSAGITNKTMRKAILNAFADAPDLPEWYDKHTLFRFGFPTWREALKSVHHPKSAQALSPNDPARMRLAFDEMVAHQIALAQMRQNYQKEAGISKKGDGHLRSQLIENLPFKLTKGQEDAVSNILKDVESEDKMLRLLQGDVGCGKTIVCLIAMLAIVEAGYQAAIMAPTEILARQHFESIHEQCKALGITVVLLTGKDKGKARKILLEAISNGTAKIIIGTHALFQDDVIFQNLGFACIDEQHRFGVEQRMRLTQKGEHCDMLAMTATPIPRTLTLTQYGDMELTKITEKPPGRKPIQTSLISTDRIHLVIEGIKRALAQNTQIYWVCPLVEESEVMDLQAAEDRARFLRDSFGDLVGVVHGRMKPQEKEEMMQAFKENKVKILVATTVIEVGVNVPNASIMIIEHAERFGLSQLHQLRGRVGRGTDEANCILLYSAPLGDTARRRLQCIRKSEDGFYIAEEDLKLRGTGDLLGTKQSGMPDFKTVDFDHHQELLYEAYAYVKEIFEKNEIEQFKPLLHLYGKLSQTPVSG